MWDAAYAGGRWLADPPLRCASWRLVRPECTSRELMPRLGKGLVKLGWVSCELAHDVLVFTLGVMQQRDVAGKHHDVLGAFAVHFLGVRRGAVSTSFHTPLVVIT